MPEYIRRKRFRPYRKGIPSAFLPLVMALGLTIGFFKLISSELRPVIQTTAVSQTMNLISITVAGAVDDCLTTEGFQYSDFITTETGSDGTIISLTGRVAECSRFKRCVIESVSTRLEDIPSDELAIPIGNLTGNLLFSGLGPDIRVNIHAVGDIVATYSNSFTAAGVNQTHHGVYLDITATVHLLIPGEMIPVTVTDRMLLDLKTCVSLSE